MDDELSIELPDHPISREQIRTQVSAAVTAKTPYMRAQVVEQISALGLPVDHDRIERALVHAEFLAWAGFTAALGEQQLLVAEEAEELLAEARFILEGFLAEMDALDAEDEDF